MKGWIFIGLVSGVAQIWGATVVAPNGLENTEGDTTAIPLFGGNEGRTQIIYGSQNFGLFPPEGVYIVELRFRLDGGINSFSGSADVELRMSTSLANPEALSTTFAANVGPDAAVVLSRTVIPLSGTQTSPNGPSAFNVVLPLPNQFLYKPSEGNLLIDTFLFGSSNLRPLDWSSSHTDNASIAQSGFVTSLTAGTVSQASPVLQLVYVPVPEPDLVGLISLGALAIAIWRKRVIP